VLTRLLPSTNSPRNRNSRASRRGEGIELPVVTLHQTTARKQRRDVRIFSRRSGEILTRTTVVLPPEGGSHIVKCSLTAEATRVIKYRPPEEEAT
jgi:hypothetical protein